jgi:myo-inositol-1(or 4)-monophosphatase
MTTYLDTAVSAATTAGETILDAYKTDVAIESKLIDDIVTEIDYKSEEIITSHIAKRYPEHAILAEESGEKEGSHSRWIIDPIDGTTNYAKGIPHFSVAIALQIDDTLELGVIYLPSEDDLYTAERTNGAFLNGDPITVSSTKNFGDSFISIGHSPDDANSDDWIQSFQAINNGARRTRHMGSAATELAYLAAGRFDGMYGTYFFPWDIAAGRVLVEEAGGYVEKLSSENELAGGYVISNNEIHDDIASAIHNRYESSV